MITTASNARVTQWQTTSVSAPTTATTSPTPSPSATASPLSAFDLGPRNSSVPYNLDVLGLDAGCSERELEDALIGRPTHFLSERGGLPSSDAGRRDLHQPPDAEEISDGRTS
ncbi:hypothetical protein CJ177_08065 [Rhodococcus sp. ACPA1]|nr:hypothetical protein CJ177_08065 [Rhodococcus sp. ACPA1]